MANTAREERAKGRAEEGPWQPSVGHARTVFVLRVPPNLSKSIKSAHTFQGLWNSVHFLIISFAWHLSLPVFLAK